MVQPRNPAAQGFGPERPALDQGRAEGRLTAGEAEEVGGDAHLAVAEIAGSDADHRDGEALLQLTRQGRRNVLHHQGKAAHVLQRERLAFERFLAGHGVALAPVAHLVHRLGR